MTAPRDDDEWMAWLAVLVEAEYDAAVEGWAEAWEAFQLQRAAAYERCRKAGTKIMPSEWRELCATEQALHERMGLATMLSRVVRAELWRPVWQLGVDDDGAS